MRLLFLVGCILSVAFGQVLNGYINPMWAMDHRRTNGRALTDRYLSQMGVTADSLYREPRLIPDLVYMDENGRYHPIYRRERMFRTEPQLYRNEQYIPINDRTTNI